ncbi:MAG TPA: Hsp20/alpha crystallin family protein [Tepidisphaeraceae bacterium]|jgi:HSP20 family protein
MNLPTRVQRALAVDPFDAFTRDFGRFFDGQNGVRETMAAYPVDVREDADRLVLEAELPGFTKDEVDITLEKGTLTISARHTENAEDTKYGEWLLRERTLTRYQRSFNLPPTVGDAVDARLENGVLTISLNKREESKPRKITVS